MLRVPNFIEMIICRLKRGSRKIHFGKKDRMEPKMGCGKLDQDRKDEREVVKVLSNMDRRGRLGLEG